MEKAVEIKAGLKNPRVVLIGGTPLGFSLLKYLLQTNVQVVGVYALEEDPHEKLKVSGGMENLCREYHIPVKVCKKISAEEKAALLSLGPDVVFVCGWRTILSSDIYTNIPYGCFAAHDSLLPRYRGCAPLNWAIINGEKETGVTLFRIEDGPVDSGKVFAQRAVCIGDRETASDVYPRITEVTLELYRELLGALKEKTLSLYFQDESAAFYKGKRRPEDGEIDWGRPAGEVYNLIRALAPPYPCARTRFNDKEIYIGKASLSAEKLQNDDAPPGRVVLIGKNGVVVACGQGQVVIHEVLMPGENELLPAARIISTTSVTLG